MTLTEILQRHAAAAGGRAAIERVNALEIAFHVVEPTFAVDGRYVATRDGQMRVDIFAGGARVFSEGVANGQAWQWLQDADHGEPSSPAGARALLHGVENHLFGLHELPGRGHQLTLLGQEQIDDAAYAVIELAYADGHTVRRYLNTSSWLIERSREHKALHPDVDPTETTIETRMSDFRPIAGGLVRPFHETQVDLATGNLLQTTTVRELRLNPAVDPAWFTCP